MTALLRSMARSSSEAMSLPFMLPTAIALSLGWRYRIIGDGIVLATRSSRQKFPAQGLADGRSGGLGAFILDPDQPSATKKLPGTGSHCAKAHCCGS